jgi:hypothetical protein
LSITPIFLPLFAGISFFQLRGQIDERFTHIEYGELVFSISVVTTQIH